MIVINNISAVSRITHPEILNLVKQRQSEIGPNFNAIVVEPWDSVSDLKTALGCPILTNILDEAVFGSDDFSPNFEVPVESETQLYQSLAYFSG